MKKRIFRTTIIVILMIICATILVLLEKTECNCDADTSTGYEESQDSQSDNVLEPNDFNELNSSEEVELSMEELSIIMNDDIANISEYNYNDPQQRMGWFKEYKEVIKKYPPELHSETIYEAYNQEELNLLFGIVQAEAGDEYGFIEKANVVSVIFNRMKTGKSLTEVLTEKNQFEPYSSGKYKQVVIDEKTILACEFVYIFGDTTFGCIAFRSHKSSCSERWYTWGDNYWEKQFGDAAHCFYR